MKPIAKFFALPWADKLLLSQSFALLGLVTAGIRIVSWRRTQNFMLRLGLKNARKRQRMSLDRITWAVRVAGHYVPKGNCLPQALVAQYLLRRDGYPAEFKIGVTKDEHGNVEAHAWVTSGDQEVIGGNVNLNRFALLTSAKGSGAYGKPS